MAQIGTPQAMSAEVAWESYQAALAAARDDEICDAPSYEDCLDEATEQILSYAESVADWLAKACNTDEGRMPLDVRPLDAIAIEDASPAVLLVLLMNGDQLQALRALHRLRELAATEFKREIHERAQELLVEAA